MGEAVADGEGLRVFAAQDPLGGGQQGGVLVAGPGRVPRPPGQLGELFTGGQGLRVFAAQDLLGGGQKGGDLVAELGRVPRLPSFRTPYRAW